MGLCERFVKVVGVILLFIYYFFLPSNVFSVNNGNHLYVGTGGYLSLSFPTGDLASDYGASYRGFGGKLMIGIKPMLSVDIGFSYNIKYPAKWDPTKGPEPEDIYDYYLTTVPITFGVSYPMKFDSMGVYFGGGGALVMEKFNVGESWVGEYPEDKNKPGFYVGGGLQYFFTDALALNANPRWLLVLDAEGDDVATPIDESTSNSMFFDLLIGVDFYFM